MSSPTGSIKARISLDRGATWKASKALGVATSKPSVAAVGNRVAVGWAATDGVRARIATTAVWSAAFSLPATDGVTTERATQPTVALYGVRGIAIVYSSCLADCDGSESGVITRSDLIWRQSTNNGATWVPSDLLAWNGSSSAGRQNDTASIVWRTSKRPYVLFNSWTEDTQAYRIYLTAGA